MRKAYIFWHPGLCTPQHLRNDQYWTNKPKFGGTCNTCGQGFPGGVYMNSPKDEVRDQFELQQTNFAPSGDTEDRFRALEARCSDLEKRLNGQERDFHCLQSEFVLKVDHAKTVGPRIKTQALEPLISQKPADNEGMQQFQDMAAKFNKPEPTKPTQVEKAKSVFGDIEEVEF